MTGSVSAADLKGRLDAQARIGLLDVREHGQYGEGHLLFASNCPYSRLELRAPHLLPDKQTEIYLYDNDDGVAQRAALRLKEIGYSDISVLSGGLPAWRAAGYGIFKGVNVPSKVLGELVELSEHTPQVTADELLDMQKEPRAPSLVDGRPANDYRKMTVPGARNIPNGELLYRFAALGLPEDQPIVIHCAGRTRGLIGAQSLINASIPNPVYALENGTQGWVLSGKELSRDNAPNVLPDLTAEQLKQGAALAERMISQHALPVIDAADLSAWRRENAYLLDVRTDEEFAAGHVPGSRHAPVVQLVQATDEWVAMRRARIALIDDNGIRAASAAFWLRQMGHDAVIVRNGLTLARKDTTPSDAGHLPAISPAELARSPGSVTILDLRSSMAFRKGHIPGALWAIRPRAATVAQDLKGPVVLVADDPGVGALFASELAAFTKVECRHLSGGMDAWIAAGEPVEASPETPPDETAIDFLFFVHDRHNGNLEASRRYLEWETGLVDQLDPMERAVFQLIRTEENAYG
ncbi:MAG: rhodanese-like domain-containing protein [Roseovarius sp.]